MNRARAGRALRRVPAVARRARAAGRSRLLSPVLTVVVVVRGRGVGLAECLRSVLSGTAVPLHVVVVAERGEQPALDATLGLAPGRRTEVVVPEGDRWLDAAIARARGRYLVLVDAEDLLAPGGLDALVAAAEETGAELVLGRSAPSAGYDVPAGRFARGDVPTAGSGLLLDLGLSHRLVRADLWRRVAPTVTSWAAAAGAAARLALDASAVVALDAVVELPQDRSRVLPVAEQPAFSVDRLAEQLAGLDDVVAVLHRQAPESVVPWLTGTLTHQLPPLCLRAVGAGPAYQRVLARAVGRWLAELPEGAVADVPVAARVSAAVAARGRWQDLALLLDFLADHPDGLPTEPAGDGARVRLPAAAADLVPGPWRRVEAVDRVARLRLDPHFRAVPDTGRWTLTGAAFGCYEPDHPPVSVRVLGAPRAVVATRPAGGPGVNEWAGRAHEDHADAGFRVEVDPGLLPDPSAGGFDVEVTHGGVTERRRVRPPEPAAPPAGAVLDAASWSDGRLAVSGRGRAAPVSAVLRGMHGGSWSGPVVRDGDAFACELRAEGAAGLAPGRHLLELRDARGRRVPARWSADLLADPPELRDERRRLVPLPDGPGPALAVRAPLGPDERSAYAQQQLRSRVYAGEAATVRELVLLESFHGRSTGDNPGAIAAELARRDLGLDLAWVVDDPTLEVPTGMRAVPRRTRAWYDALARSRVYVGNAAAPYFFEKRPGQLHLQTWHGTPLKRIGEDRGPGDFTTWRHRRRVEAQAARWDAMLSPSAYCSDIFRSAFHYDGEFWEIGYPRNDLLLGPDAGRVRERVRRGLGVAEGTRVVLYAPTWRDHLGDRESKPLFLDARRLTRAFPDVVVLVRGHYTGLNEAEAFAGQQRVHDVTRYPDIADLYLAADVLVTDYSSVMFDFVLTDKPVVLLTPDLERYREVERGFYFELEERAPGPLTRTTAGVVEALSRPDRDAARRAEFRAAFCPWEDGRSAERAVDRLLARW